MSSTNMHFDEFASLSSKFSAYHQDHLNVALHFITTPLGFFGFLSLVMSIMQSTSAAALLCLMFIVSLMSSVPVGAFVGTILLTLLCLLAARQAKLRPFSALLVIAIAYVLQDLAHVISGEKTYQSTYSAGGQIDFANPAAWLSLFTEHCLYLLPLCVQLVVPHISFCPHTAASLAEPLPNFLQQLQVHSYIILPLFLWSVGSYCLDARNGWCIYPGSAYASRVRTCNIATDPTTDPESRKADLALIRAWALRKIPPQNMSSHWWVSDLEPAERAAFERCAASSHIVKMFRSIFSEKYYTMEIVAGMNEVYVTGPARTGEKFNSDQIFYTKHVDGPYGLIPFVSVYRCIVGMDRNLMVATRFPLVEESYNACEGDVLGFDFNREIHYITRDESKKDVSDEYRVVLKLHYCFYPRVLAPLGWFMHAANVRYNIAFRQLFLKTINPKTPYEHFLAFNVVMNTALFNNIETYIGQRNIIFLIFAVSMWRLTGSYTSFLMLTSFVHYVRYIGTYYYREGVDFGSFKRDVLFFKTLSLLQLFRYYFLPTNGSFEFDPVSIAMIVIGYGVSMKATQALGLDKTYFGAELGKCEPFWVTAFPFGYIPHPMILGQVVALLGVLKADHFRACCPYLVHCHVALYLTHMFQEHFDIYQSRMMQIFAVKRKVKTF